MPDVPIAPAAPTPSPLRAAVVGSIGGKALEMVTLVALATLVPRVLGPAAYGAFSVPLTVVTLSSLAMTLGGPAVLARYVPAVEAERRPALARAIGLRLARGRGVQLVAVAAVALLAAVVAPSVFPAGITALVVAAIAANVGAQLCLQVGLGLGRTNAWSLRYPIHNTVLVAAVLVMEPRWGEVGAATAILVAGVVTLAFGMWVVGPLRGLGHTDATVPTGAIRFGILQASGAALTQFAQRGAVLAAAVLAPSALDAGYAALAVGIALGATYAVLQAFTVTLPHLADAVRRHGDDTAGAERSLRRLAHQSVAGLTTGAVVAVATVDSLVPTVFGAEYEMAAGAFVPAAAVVVLAPLNSLAVQVAALRMRPEVVTWCGAAAAVAFVAAATAMTPAWGASGALGATLAAVSASAVVAVVFLGRAVGRLLTAGSAAGVAAVLVTAVVAR